MVIRHLKGSRVTSGYKLATVEMKYTLPDVLLEEQVTQCTFLSLAEIFDYTESVSVSVIFIW